MFDLPGGLLASFLARLLVFVHVRCPGSCVHPQVTVIPVRWAVPASRANMLSFLVLPHLRMRVCNACDAFFMLHANVVAASREPTEHLTVGHAVAGAVDQVLFFF